MRQGFRQSMAWLHAWSGLVVGWVLFCVFVTGTASYYRTEISQWMRPELAATESEPARSADLAAAYLQRAMPDATGWYIELPKPEKPLIGVMWWKSLEGPFHQALLDPATGTPTKARDTRGGDFLYRFHFELGMPPLWGRWIVGTCALVMLVALVSGIVTHRRIFADFFTFRRRRSQRGWLDAHNVFGVLALPFHLMITYTGLVTLAPMYMPWGVVSAYKGDEMRFYVDSGLMPELRAPSGKPGTLAPLSGMVAQGIAARGEAPEGVSVFNPADATPSVLAVFEEPHGLAHEHPQIAFDGATGAMLGSNGATRAAAKTSTVMLGLHEGHFAGAALRVLFFLCGVMGAATVATGLVLWAVARAPQGAEAEGFGLRLVRTLNVGTIVGLPAGITAYFLANRLLPLDLAARADWEVGTFFGAWALVAVAGALRPAESVWREGLGLVGGLFLAVPVVGAITTGLHPLAGETRFLGFDAAMIALGILLGLAARKAGQARLRPALREDAGITGGEALRA
ncbi:PepSY-associated TM helix domain-containing protein [Methylobacterium sp. WL6]|uniref:PepSY-associated TM helix domain-containing protein n=1 Tax=Methylobacterium sp. WL6 TaxID=2603901 RepID=UPI0011C9A5D5|nr:PepSY-associated TM helix domain-containing protein [Methylobacterium sp. WL6]TXN71230.1 PepSY domain-containing protein [Methylobacterium sp. WL6]